MGEKLRNIDQILFWSKYVGFGQNPWRGDVVEEMARRVDECYMSLRY